MHLLTMCLPKKYTQIFTHEYERCVNISAICRHTKHLTAWMRDIIKYAERTGAVGLSMNDLFLGLWHPSVVMSSCPNLLSYSLMLQIDHLFWDPYSLLAIFCHLFERHLVLCSCNVISGQPLIGRGWQCWLPSSALCQVQFSSVGGVWCPPPSILWLLAIVAILLLGT